MLDGLGIGLLNRQYARGLIKMSLEFYLWSQQQIKHTKAVEELLTEITYRLIACEQSIRGVSNQLEEQSKKGGVQ